MSTPRGRLVWGVLVGIGLTVEAWGIFHPGAEDTLSEFTRWAFATDTTAGKWIFGAAWVGFAAWFLPHIVGAARKSSASISPSKDDAEP